MTASDDDFHFLKIGEIRPSQMTHTYGVGAIVELPFLSVVTRSHEDWKERDSDGVDVMRVVAEPRLLEAVQHDVGRSVEELRTPPIKASANRRNPAKDPANWIGAWGWPFPRWLRCGRCSMLTTVDTGMFRWRLDAFRPHDAGYFHEGCGGFNVRATPVRVVTACKAGHLDDFPWVEFAHRQTGHRCPADAPSLALKDRGYAERATDLTVECVACDHPPVSIDLAFGMHARTQMPTCRGFHPHLRQFDPKDCDLTAEALMVGASNLWFPLKRSVLSIPGPRDEAIEFVGKHWGRLSKVPTYDALTEMADPDHYAFYPALASEGVPLEDIWNVVEERKQDQEENADQPTARPDLLLPEWETFTTKDSADNRNFRMVNAGEPTTIHEATFRETRQLTRLREVVALTGFTRLESIDADDLEHMPSVQRAPLSRIRQDGKPKTSWLPVAESLGEGILVVLDELAVAAWEADATNHLRLEGLRDAHRTWRSSRDLDPNGRLPQARYVLLHTLAHLLINELALEAGYNTASIRERIYARPTDAESGPMAGIMLYTSEPDAEGTLGGLVALGDPDRLGATIDAALRRAQLCSSDPFCSEHEATAHEGAMHGAACHSCVFLPETSCESANRYLDRSFVVPTLSCDDGLALFPWTT